MEFAEILSSRRTVRLYQPKPVADDLLASLVDAARVASCASNKQRLRYTIVREEKTVLQVLAHTRWAGLVQPRRTPQPGVSAPAAFIVLTAASEINDLLWADAGAAVQSMEFAACDAGLGCCWLGAIDREAIQNILGCGQIVYLLAVGYPAETPVSEDVPVSGDVSYYLDGSNTLHVPKIKLEDLITWN